MSLQLAQSLSDYHLKIRTANATASVVALNLTVIENRKRSLRFASKIEPNEKASPVMDDAFED